MAGASRGFTDTHHVAVVLPEAMTGDWAVGRLARAGIYVSSTHVPSPDGPVGDGDGEAPCEVRAPQ